MSAREREPLLRRICAGDAELERKSAICFDRDKTNSDTWRRYYAESLLGASLAGLGKNAEAEPRLISGYRYMLERQSSIPAENRSILSQTRTWIAQVYEATGKSDQAREWQNELSTR